MIAHVHPAADDVLAARRLPIGAVLASAIWLCGVALLVVLVWGVPDTGEALVALANAALSLGGAIWCCAGRLRPVGAVYFFFTFAWLGIAPIVQLSTDQAAWGDAYAFVEPDRVLLGLTMNLTATTAFIAGGVIARRRAERKRSRSARSPGGTGVRPRALHVVALLLLAVSPLAVRANGGLGTFFVTQDERSTTLADAGLDLANSGGVQVALITTLPSALAAAGAILAIARLHDLRRRPEVGRAAIVRLELLFFISGIVVFANPFSNTRFLSAAAIGATLMIALRPRSATAGLVFGLVALLAIVVLYPLSSVFKTATSTAVVDPLSAFTGPDFDGFQQVLNALTFVQDTGHTWGIYLVSAIGYFVPRSIWPAKAEPASLDVAANAGYGFTNLSLPLHAELYIEFGWVGMILAMVLLGVLVQRLDSAWLRGAAPFMPLVAYLSLSMLSVIRGPLGAQVPVYLTVTAILVLSIRFRPASAVASDHRRMRVRRRGLTGAPDGRRGGARPLW